MADTTTSTDRRRFLKATGTLTLAGAAAGSATAESPPALQETNGFKPPGQPGARRIAAAGTKSGSDSTVTPPLAVRALSKMGFGHARGVTGASGANPDVILSSGFESFTSGFSQVGDLAYFASLGSTDDERLANYVEEQLNPTSEDPELDARLAQFPGEFDTLGMPLADAWSAYECTGFSNYSRPQAQTERFYLNAAVYSRWQLFYLVADFWHNHFNVYSRINRDTYVSWASWDRDIIRAHAFGNFYDMVYASAKHPTMLRYLDNYVNGDGGSINENYCRELFELHCLGATSYAGNENPRFVQALASNPYTALQDSELDDISLGYLADPNLDVAAVYTDDDVLTAAQSMTGWRYEDADTETSCGTGAFYTDEQEHNSDSTKAVLTLGVAAIPSGLDAETEGRLIVKLAAYHPATAEYVCRKLCQRLVADDPPQSVVDAAAQTFLQHRRSPDQIARTLRTILLSDEFKDPASWGRKMRRPLDYVASAMRAAGCDHTWRTGDSTTNSLLSRFNAAGQRLFDWRTPDGYPDVRDHWEGSTTLVQLWRTVDYLLDRNVSNNDTRVMRVLDITLGSFSTDPTPRDLVEFWCNWALGFTPNGGWTGPTGAAYDSAPTTIGRACLQFMTQAYPESDAGAWDADTPIDRDDLDGDRSPGYWRSRLTGLVKLILWSPQFMQR
ncbi:MAG: DUF1800 domain-containing protein [Xanthomonadales bacterium]|nr:DUF1800 domain-containing protein [Xanthomonadales bacterium]